MEAWFLNLYKHANANARLIRENSKMILYSFVWGFYFIFMNLSLFYMNIKVYALLGGTIKDDIKGLSNGTQIVIGTPGRVLDMVNKR